jgi:O-antigen ligase
MKIHLDIIKIFLIACVGIVLPWGRNFPIPHVYPPLFFVIFTFILIGYLPQTGIRIPFPFRLFFLYILLHIALTAVLLGSNYLSLVHVEGQLVGGVRSYYVSTAVFANIAQLLFFIFFFIIMTSVLQNRTEWIVFVCSFICGLALACLWTLKTQGIANVRFTGGYNNANGIGMSATIALFLSMAMLGMLGNKLLKIFAIGLSIFFLIILLLSQSRGALVALLMGGLIIIKNNKMQWYKIFIVGIFILILLILIRPLVPDRFLFIDSWFEDRGTKRLDIWSIYLSHFWEFFFTGVGYTRSTDVITTGLLGNAYATHNVFLELLVEFGIGGLLLFSFVLRNIWSSLQRLSSQFTYTAAIKAAFLSWILGACFTSSFVQRETWLIFSLMATFPAIIGTSNKHVGANG